MSDALPIADLAAGGGLTGAGGAGGGGQYQSTAKSGNKEMLSEALHGTSGAGNRGFINNVAFPGATLNADQGATDSGTGDSSMFKWLAVAAVAIVALKYLKR